MYFEKNKIIAGIVGLVAVVSIVNTQAIIKISKNFNSKNNQVAAVSSSRPAVPVTHVVETKGGQTIEDYLKEKYPTDYQKRVSRIEFKLNALVSKYDQEDPTELRRFLCWLTGGTWVQVGIYRSCIYPGSFEMLSNPDIGTGFIGLIHSYLKTSQSSEAIAFASRASDRDSFTTSVQKILTDEGVEAEIDSFSFRRFLCRLLGGRWEEGVTGAADIPDVPSSYSINYSICVY